MFTSAVPSESNSGPSVGRTRSEMVSSAVVNPPSSGPMPSSALFSPSNTDASCPLAADWENAAPMESPMCAIDCPIPSMAGAATWTKSRMPWVASPVPDRNPLIRFVAPANVSFRPWMPRADPTKFIASSAAPFSSVATPFIPVFSTGSTRPATSVNVEPKFASRVFCTDFWTSSSAGFSVTNALTSSCAFGASFDIASA
ncbi:hypothetical protein B7C42_08246 [Nocardia cerradoensis]|uniref:Uncharacterized protein n=1 Tax=Nocardia cerradoensis TaxID=85688 RepID=A0A231GT77_9NOCA|nr:hypothetical protein B7C42_08246 [Nocardia cerradoensis]